MTDREKAEYADVVWVTFLQRLPYHDRPLFMSPMNWETLKGWLDAEIPLRIVLRGMQDTGGKGKTLSYYEGPVRNAYEYARQAVPL